MSGLIKIDGAELLKKAKESAENRQNERAIRKVRDLMVAREAFHGAMEEIDGIIAGIEKNDVLAYEKMEKMSSFVQRIKSVVFDRNAEVQYMNKGYSSYGVANSFDGDNDF